MTQYDPQTRPSAVDGPSAGRTAGAVAARQALSETLRSIDSSHFPPGYRCRVLQLTDRDDIVALRRRVLARLDDSDQYVKERDEAGFIETHCGRDGQTLGIFSSTGPESDATVGIRAERGHDGRAAADVHITDAPLHTGRLIAYGMIHLPFDPPSASPTDRQGPPARTASHLPPPRRPCWSDALERARLPEMASCMVDPEHRGSHLQRHLIDWRLQLARHHHADYIWGMVSPRNPASRHNLEAAGFQVAWTGVIDGRIRHVMARRNHRVHR